MEGVCVRMREKYTILYYQYNSTFLGKARLIEHFTLLEEYTHVLTSHGKFLCDPDSFFARSYDL